MFNKTKINENGWGWLSHVDIIDILKLKLSVKLVKDCEFNALLYKKMI